jgi:hypothetical protein
MQKPKSTLWITVGAFTAALVLLLLLAGLAIFLLDATRAYTNGESLYTKGQKEAVIALQHYAHSRDQRDLDAYHQAIEVPLGDRDARQALERRPPDLEAARRGFLQGGNHPDDIGFMIRLFLWLDDTPVFRPPLHQWREADAHIVEIQSVAQELEAAMHGDAGTTAGRDRLLDRLAKLNKLASDAQAGFSAAVGESARAARGAFVLILAATSLLL